MTEIYKIGQRDDFIINFRLHAGVKLLSELSIINTLVCKNTRTLEGEKNCENSNVCKCIDDWIHDDIKD